MNFLVLDLLGLSDRRTEGPKLCCSAALLPFAEGQGGGKLARTAKQAAKMTKASIVPEAWETNMETKAKTLRELRSTSPHIQTESAAGGNMGVPA